MAMFIFCMTAAGPFVTTTRQWAIRARRFVSTWCWRCWCCKKRQI